MMRCVLIVALTILCAYGESTLDWIENNGACFFFSNDSLPWEGAANACKMHDAGLVQFENQTKHDWVAGQLKERKISDVWTAGKRNNKIWEWVSSKIPIKAFTNWNPGQPDNSENKEHCLHVHNYNSNYKWNDASCANKYRYVCEKSEDCTCHH